MPSQPSIVLRKKFFLLILIVRAWTRICTHYEKRTNTTSNWCIRFVARTGKSVNLHDQGMGSSTAVAGQNTNTFEIPLSPLTLLEIRGHSMTRTRDFPVFKYAHVHGPNVRRFRFARGRPTHHRQIAFSKHTTSLTSYYIIIIMRHLRGTRTSMYLYTYIHGFCSARPTKAIHISSSFFGKSFSFRPHDVVKRR